MSKKPENEIAEKNIDEITELDIDSLDVVTGGNLRRTVSTQTTSISEDTMRKI